MCPEESGAALWWFPGMSNVSRRAGGNPTTRDTGGSLWEPAVCSARIGRRVGAHRRFQRLCNLMEPILPHSGTLRARMTDQEPRTTGRNDIATEMKRFDHRFHRWAQIRPRANWPCVVTTCPLSRLTLGRVDRKPRRSLIPSSTYVPSSSYLYPSVKSVVTLLLHLRCGQSPRSVFRGESSARCGSIEP